MRFLRYENKPTSRGNLEEVHAVFQIGTMPNPFGVGDGALSLNMTKDGLMRRVGAKMDSREQRLVLYDVLLNWPDPEGKRMT